MQSPHPMECTSQCTIAYPGAPQTIQLGIATTRSWRRGFPQTSVSFLFCIEHGINILHAALSFFEFVLAVLSLSGKKGLFFWVCACCSLSFSLSLSVEKKVSHAILSPLWNAFVSVQLRIAGNPQSAQVGNSTTSTTSNSSNTTNKTASTYKAQKMRLWRTLSTVDRNQLHTMV